MLAKGGHSTDEVMTSILQARHINQALGASVVGPGDLDDLQEEFIDACRVISIEIPRKIIGEPD